MALNYLINKCPAWVVMYVSYGQKLHELSLYNNVIAIYEPLS